MSTPVLADDTGEQRWYTHPVTGERFLSVTSALGYVSKFGLIDWAAKLSAEAAVRRGADVAEAASLSPCNALPGGECGRCGPCMTSWLANRHNVVRDTAADLGSRFHEAAEAHTLGGLGATVDADVRPFFDAYTTWADRVRPRIEAAEATVIHRSFGYAGTLDAVMVIPAAADLPASMRHLRGRRLVVDFKTGKHVGAQAAWQLAAYRFAEAVLLPEGDEEPVPAVDGGLVLHIRPEGVAMREAHIGPKTFNKFLHALRVAEGVMAPLGESLSRPARLTEKKKASV